MFENVALELAVAYGLLGRADTEYR